jgi:quinol monooxygenase YgiN
VIVYVDTAEVRDGALEELKEAIKELVDFFEANEPRLIAYSVYFSEDGTRMSVIHVHPDAESLEYHLDLAGPVLRRFVDLVTLSSIEIYGEPTEKLVEQLHEKARLLGRGAVVKADDLHAGFTRFLEAAVPENPERP